MEMKDPTTTAQPQPPSGGVYPAGPPSAGGMSAHQEEGGDGVTAGFRGEEKAGSEPGEKQSRELVKINIDSKRR